ncbi:MAG: hypothetical protein KGO49_00725 [Gammaproteobacteria bacterium]|nr:hypothetical protein [Gammaproteobacteria bacterium]
MDKNKKYLDERDLAKLPEKNVFLELPTEKVAEILIEFSKKTLTDVQDGDYKFSPQSISSSILSHYKENVPLTPNDELKDLLDEAWAWLTYNLIIIKSNSTALSINYWMKFSRLGKRIQKEGVLDKYLIGSKFPKNQLHPVIFDRAWLSFLSGQYDTSAMVAFKALEIAVRTACIEKTGAPPCDKNGGQLYGVQLMFSAFKKETGILADVKMELNEQDGLAMLFGGAIGFFRNSAMHKAIEMEPTQCFDQLLFASHLMRILDDQLESLRNSV